MNHVGKKDLVDCEEVLSPTIFFLFHFLANFKISDSPDFTVSTM